MKTLIAVFIISVCAVSCTESNEDVALKDLKPVRIFVAWPGLESRPHYYWELNDSKPRGVEPELIELILEEANLDYEYVTEYNFSGEGDPRIEVLTTDNADISIRGITVTPERRKEVLFSKSYYTDGLGALVRDESTIFTLDDLESKAVFAHAFTTAYDWVKTELPNCDLKTFKEGDEFIEPDSLLLDNKIDAYILDFSFLNYLAKKHTGLRVLDGKFTEEKLAIAISKDNIELKAKIDKALSTVKKSEKFKELIRRLDN